MTLGHDDYKLTLLTCFLVVNQPLVYNAILGHPLMKQAQMVETVYCLTVKFPTPKGIGYVRADRTVEMKCYLNSLRIVESHKWTQDVMEIVGVQDILIEQLNCREDTFKPLPVEQKTRIELVVSDKKKVTNVGALLSAPEQ